jgi:hypothetical protein
MEKITQGRDIFRNALLGSIQNAAYTNNVALVAGAAQHTTIPTGADLVVFGAPGGVDVYVKIKAANTDIAVPAANITDGSSPELNPGARSIRSTDKYICMISPQGGNITLAYFSAEVRV